MPPLLFDTIFDETPLANAVVAACETRFDGSKAIRDLIGGAPKEELEVMILGNSPDTKESPLSLACKGTRIDIVRYFLKFVGKIPRNYLRTIIANHYTETKSEDVPTLSRRSKILKLLTGEEYKESEEWSVYSAINSNKSTYVNNSPDRNKDYCKLVLDAIENKDKTGKRHLVDVDDVDDTGSSSIELACHYGLYDIVHLLLECGADMNLGYNNSSGLVSKHGGVRTPPLIISVTVLSTYYIETGKLNIDGIDERKKAIYELLLEECDVDINIIDQGRTAKYYAFQNRFNQEIADSSRYTYESCLQLLEKAEETAVSRPATSQKVTQTEDEEQLIPAQVNKDIDSTFSELFGDSLVSESGIIEDPAYNRRTIFLKVLRTVTHQEGWKSINTQVVTPLITEIIEKNGVNAMDSQNRTLLLLACKFGFLELLDYLVEQSKKKRTQLLFNKKPLNDTLSPVLAGCYFAQYKIVERLMELKGQGENIDVLTGHPIILACTAISESSMRFYTDIHR